MKLVVTGSRNGCPQVDYWLTRFVNEVCRPDLVILGCARGVDTQAKLWAQRLNLPYIVYRADWETHGKAAGPIRNREMVNAASRGDYCVAFLEQGSRGTLDCLTYAQKRHLICYVFNI